MCVLVVCVCVRARTRVCVCECVCVDGWMGDLHMHHVCVHVCVCVCMDGWVDAACMLASVVCIIVHSHAYVCLHMHSKSCLFTLGSFGWILLSWRGYYIICSEVDIVCQSFAELLVPQYH